MLKNNNFLTVAELCAYLGVSKSCVYKLSHYKTLPKYRPNGKKIWFKESEIQEWMDKHKISSMDELNNQINIEELKKQ
jgi:excisionase family DNA binding protein